MNTPLLLRGVDLAAFAAALVARLRAAGVLVSGDGPSSFVLALRQLAPRGSSQLYWAARLTQVNRADDLAAFDSVFAAAFGDAPAGANPQRLHGDPRRQRAGARMPAGRAQTRPAATLPWSNRSPRMGVLDHADSDVAKARAPDPLPSQVATRAEEPFERFDPDDLRLLGSWLATSVAAWPRRRSLRQEPSRHGKTIDLRATMNASRATGWETVMLARTRRRRRHRRVVLVCDVSRSMQPYVTIYLHLMRAAVLRQAGIRPEVFAFSTSLTRLTAVLAHRSAEAALARANAKVTDRYSGTHIGGSIGALLTPPHGNALRGAVVIIASDGWDADPPELLGHALARLRRRAETIVWLNPRAAQREFQPLTGSMAAALPYCDLFLPANSLAGLRQLFDALAGQDSALRSRRDPSYPARGHRRGRGRVRR
jgi:uncharacterized protein with von Willebrand factor type A (vWA) domain